MGKTYHRAGDGVDWLIRQVMENNHPDLHREGVTVGALRVFSDDGAPLKSKGYPAVADIKPTSLEDRVRGLPDAKLRLDGSAWSDMTPEARTALIDHELTHLELVCDKETGDPVRDDHNRPRLKSRPHDWEIGGFDEVVRRHGDHAPELRALRAAENRLSQKRFDFDQPDGGGVKAEGGDADWRALPVGTLKEHGLAAAVVGKLEVAGLTTLGAVQDWTSSGKQLTDIDGIGGAKAEAIEDAYEKFWAARNQLAKVAEEAKAVDEEAA